MRLFLVCLLTLSIFCKSRAQGIPDGLWNAGGVIVPAFSGKSGETQPALRKSSILIDLYPGVSVVKSGYELYNPDTISMECRVELRDSGRYKESATGMMFTRKSALVKALKNDTLITPAFDQMKGVYTWTFSIPARSSIHFNIYQLTENYQSKLVNEGNSREANAMVIVNEMPGKFNTDTCKVMVRLKESLTLTNILGLSPAKKITGDLHHLYYELKDAPMVIWYEGLAGDFKFDKKVLPNAELLFAEIDKFPEAEFKNLSFTVIDRYNFSTNPKNPLAAILYFIMFFAPWVILIGFIIFLLKKPKKKNISQQS